MGGVRVAVRALRRADPALPQTHGRQTLPLPPLRALLLALRPPRAPRQAPRVAAKPAARRQVQPQARQAHLQLAAAARPSVSELWSWDPCGIERFLASTGTVDAPARAASRAKRCKPKNAATPRSRVNTHAPNALKLFFIIF